MKGKPADPPTLQSSTRTGTTAAGGERRSTCSHDFMSEHKIICVYLELRSENQNQKKKPLRKKPNSKVEAVMHALQLKRTSKTRSRDTIWNLCGNREDQVAGDKTNDKRITENTDRAAQVHHSSRRVVGDLVLRGLWTLCSVL